MKILIINKIHQLYLFAIIILSNMLYETYPFIVNKQNIIRKLIPSTYLLNKQNNYIFSLQPSLSTTSTSITEQSPIISSQIDDIKWILQFDGGSSPNPGRGGAGSVIFAVNIKTGKFKEIWNKYKFLGRTGITNNVAEYKGLTEGLKQIIKMKIQSVEIQGDSELIINQVQGKYKVNNANLKSCNIIARKLLLKIKEKTFTHIRRELNSRADALSNDAKLLGKTESKMNYDNLNDLQIMFQLKNSKPTIPTNNNLNNNDDDDSNISKTRDKTNKNKTNKGNTDNSELIDKSETSYNKVVAKKTSKKVPRIKQIGKQLEDMPVAIDRYTIVKNRTTTTSYNSSSNSSSNSNDSSSILNNKIRSVSNLKKSKITSKEKRTLTTTTRNNRLNDTNSNNNMNAATHKLIIIPVYQEISIMNHDINKKKSKNNVDDKSNLSKQQILSNVISNGYGIIAERFRNIDQPTVEKLSDNNSINNMNTNLKNFIPTLEFLSYELQSSTFFTCLAKLFFVNNSFITAQNAHSNITDSYLFDYLNQNKLNGKIIKRDTIWSPSIKNIHSMINYGEKYQNNTIINNHNDTTIMKEEINDNHNISNAIVTDIFENNNMIINCIEESFKNENATNIFTGNIASSVVHDTNGIENLQFITINNNETNNTINTTIESCQITNAINIAIDSNDTNTNTTMNSSGNNSMIDLVTCMNINSSDIANTNNTINEMIIESNNSTTDISLDFVSNSFQIQNNHESNSNDLYNLSTVLSNINFAQYREFSYLENHYSLTSSITVYLIELENKESLMKTIKKINDKATTNFIKNAKSSQQTKSNLNKNGKFTKNLIQQGLIQLLPLKINNMVPYLQNESYYNGKSVDPFLFSWALGTNICSNFNMESNNDIIETSYCM